MIGHTPMSIEGHPDFEMTFIILARILVVQARILSKISFGKALARPGQPLSHLARIPYHGKVSKSHVDIWHS